MLIYWILPIMMILTTESISWGLSIIAQQKYLKAFNISTRRSYETSIMLSVFSIISIILSILLYSFQYKMHLILFLDINILYTSIVLLFNLFIPYVFFYISHASNMPFANFPLASKLILKLLIKFFNIDIGTTNRSITRSGTSILIDFLDTIPELVWCKDQVNRYKYVNSATCKTLLMLDREVVEGKTAKEIANHLRTKNIRYTFSEICYDSDEYTKEQKKPCTFYEYGYIGEKYIALHILKIPIFKDDNVMGTIALAREVTTLINQQTTIEQLFLNGNIEEGINKFLQYHQQFKSVKNVHLDIN